MTTPWIRFRCILCHASVVDPYFGDDIEASIPPLGRVTGRIEPVKLVPGVISETMGGFFDTINDLTGLYRTDGNVVTSG